MFIINIINLLLRTSLTFIVLFITTRLLGKKQLSHLTFFNYVTGITIGSIAANIISFSDKPFIEDFIALAWWCILSTLLGFIGLKSGKLRTIIDGEPTILIKKGNIVKNALKSNRVNMDDISMLLREQGVFSVTEVEYAILEPDGKISVLKKPKYQQVTKEDMNIKLPVLKFIPTEIIVDGEVILKNLKEYNLDESWLDKQLSKQNVKSPKYVLYAEIQSDGTLYIETY